MIAALGAAAMPAFLPEMVALFTAGAAIGHLDLALWLVRQASPELAAWEGRASTSR